MHRRTSDCNQYAGLSVPVSPPAPATLSYGLGNWFLVRGDTTQARTWFGRAIQSDRWPAFGFIVAERERRQFR